LNCSNKLTDLIISSIIQTFGYSFHHSQLDEHARIVYLTCEVKKSEIACAVRIKEIWQQSLVSWEHFSKRDFSLE